MKNPLKTLERIKKFEVDEQRRLLVVELDKLDNLQKKLNDMIVRYEREKDFVAANPTICDFGAYTKQYLKDKKNVEQQIAKIENKIEAIRDVMADIFKEQKTFEIVERSRKEKEQKELDDQSKKMLDEIGTNTYIKKHQQQ